MFEKFREKIAALVAPERSRRLYVLQQDLGNLAKNIDQETSRRVAEIVSKMDAFEPLMKEFHGLFSQEFRHPEENLDQPGQLGMYMMGHRVVNDPHFKHLTDWIMNAHANEMFKRPNLNRDNALDAVLYVKAQLSSMILLKRELGRLGSNYEEILHKNEDEAFNRDSITEE